MRYLLLLLALCWTARGANPSFGDFNTNQFTTNANKVAIKDGVKLTNAVLAGAITGAYAEFANNVQVDGQLDIVGTGNLQGRALSALSQNGTNGAPAVNFTNSPTVTWSRSGSNWMATAASTVNNLTATQYVRMPWNTLTMTGSNVSTIDFSAGSMWKLVATNNAFLGTPSNMPGTNVAQVIQFAFIQDSTGTRTLTVTNGSWELSGSGTSTNQLVPVNTNGNAMTIVSFVTSPTSATKAVGVVAAIGQ
jgi:hypothetical protein